MLLGKVTYVAFQLCSECGIPPDIKCF